MGSTPPSQAGFEKAMDYLKDSLELSGSTGTFNIDGNDLLGKLGLWQVVGIDLVLVGVVDSAGEGAVGTSSFNSSYWRGSCRCDRPMTSENWMSVLEVLSVQMSLGKDDPTLPAGSATCEYLDSRVLFSDSKDKARIEKRR